MRSILKLSAIVILLGASEAYVSYQDVGEGTFEGSTEASKHLTPSNIIVSKDPTTKENPDPFQFGNLKETKLGLRKLRNKKNRGKAGKNGYSNQPLGPFDSGPSVEAGFGNSGGQNRGRGEKWDGGGQNRGRGRKWDDGKGGRHKERNNRDRDRGGRARRNKGGRGGRNRGGGRDIRRGGKGGGRNKQGRKNQPGW